MARQIFWTRLAAGFPPGVRVSGKTGTLPGLHLEAGVAEYPDGGRYAIAVFARAERLTPRRIDVDLAMGEAARDGRRGAARRLIFRPSERRRTPAEQDRYPMAYRSRRSFDLGPAPAALVGSWSTQSPDHGE